MFLAHALVAIPAAVLSFGDPCNPEMPGSVPDLDQVRRAAQSVDGSPVDGLDFDGYAHCGPTTLLDLLLYMANNGYPSLLPGPGGYIGGGNPMYNSYTAILDDLGNRMIVNETTGTTNSNWQDEINDQIAAAGLTGVIIRASVYTSDISAPGLTNISSSIGFEWPTAATVGWYSQSGGTYHRESGHIFPVRRCQDLCGPGQAKIGIRDPATDNDLTDDGDPFRQSQPSTETYTVTAINSTFEIGNTDYVGPLVRMNGYTFEGLPANTSAFIDAVHVFIPIYGLSPCCDDLGIQVHSPEPFGGPSTTQTFTLPPGTPIIDATTAAVRHRMFAIVDRTNASSPRTLWEIDRASGAATPVSLPGSPHTICAGREDGRLYVLMQDGSVRLVSRGVAGAPMTPPAPVDALTFDYERDQLVALSSSARRAFRFDAATLALESDQMIPTAMPIGPSPRITICPVGAYLWLASGINRVDGLFGSGPVLNLAATIVEPSSVLEGVDADDRGHVFTSAAGQIHEFAPPTPPNTAWTRVSTSKFDGFAVGGAGGAGRFFQIGRSVSNLTPAIHDGGQYHHAMPTSFTASVPDCPADVNNSGSPTTQDIFDFLVYFFSGDPRGDFDNSGTFTAQDIFDFLAAYFRGC